MLDEEQTAKNERSSCVPAKGFILLCNSLISVILLSCTECFSGSSVALILQQKIYQLFFLMFPQHVELCVHCCVVFQGSRLTPILIE